ncbi:MAG: hypothetical protein H0W85_07540 [Methylotenera sp.]|nr:hypothetical protein [Methylotenera sp.]
MHKLVTTWFASAIAFSQGTAAFAADAPKAKEPAKAVATKSKKEKPVVPAAKKAKKEEVKTDVTPAAK